MFRTFRVTLEILYYNTYLFGNKIKADPVVVGNLEEWFSGHTISPQIITRFQCRV